MAMAQGLELSASFRTYTYIYLYIYVERENTYIPQIHMRVVADTKLLARGAMAMAEANIKSPMIHAVSRSGLIPSSFSSKPAMTLGGRGVNFSSAGDRTIMGRKKAARKLTVEYSTRAKLPIRPISPNTSALELFASEGVSYRIFVSPTQTVE